MALLESLACGTPLVTTTHSAPQELVREGVTGMLCPPADPGALAAACLRGLALARRPGPADACRASAQPYDWDAGLAPLCERLYPTGADRRRPGYGPRPEHGPDHRSGRLRRRASRRRDDARGLDARALSRDPAPWLGIPEAVLDLCTAARGRPRGACAGCDAVVHLAGEDELVAARDPERALGGTVLAAQRLAAACRGGARARGSSTSRPCTSTGRG